MRCPKYRNLREKPWQLVYLLGRARPIHGRQKVAFSTCVENEMLTDAAVTYIVDGNVTIH